MFFAIHDKAVQRGVVVYVLQAKFIPWFWPRTHPSLSSPAPNTENRRRRHFRGKDNWATLTSCFLAPDQSWQVSGDYIQFWGSNQAWVCVK